MRHLLFVLLAATASAGQVVEIDGEQFVVGAKSATSEVVTVKVMPYSAKLGDDSKGIVTGYIVSHLPTRHIRVNLDISFWEVSNGKLVTEQPRFTVKTSVDNPVPKKPTKFRAAADFPIDPRTHLVRYLHSVSVTLEKLPAKIGKR